jgi:hypothetical protein
VKSAHQLQRAFHVCKDFTSQLLQVTLHVQAAQWDAKPALTWVPAENVSNSITCTQIIHASLALETAFNVRPKRLAWSVMKGIIWMGQSVNCAE